MAYIQKATDNPFGASPYDAVLRISAYPKDATAARIYPGDFVIQEADGAVAPATTNSSFIVGVAAEGSAGATADTEVLVYDHPDQLFVIQDDSATSWATEAGRGINYNIVAGAGSTVLDRSAHELDIDSGTTTAAPLRLVALHPIEGGTWATATANPRKLVVQINQHAHSTTVGV